MGADGFKQLGEHRDGCFTAKRGGEFIVHDGIDSRRKMNGDRGGSTAWHRFRCNDHDCGAVAIVRWDVLMDFIKAGLAANPDTPNQKGEQR